jgi:thiol-disulfide isomerase/thioredoxin
MPDFFLLWTCLISPAQAVEVGAPLPAFTLTDASGATKTQASYTGKPLLLNLWATWCRPCLAELPLLDTVAARWPTWQFVGVSLDPDPATAKAWLQKSPLRFPTLFDPKGSTFEALDLIAVPATYLVDATGTVRWNRVGAIRDGDLPAMEAAMKGIPAPQAAGVPR